jgi:ribosomal-protein-alanine N-acetyltransferase
MTIIIRRMTLDDVPAVHRIDQLSFSLPWSERSFRHEIEENPVSRCWLAEEDGKIAAMLVLWLIEDEVHIATIATHPDYRCRGIGENLMVEALTHAREEGAKYAFLEVRVSNLAAQALYKKYGFKEDGIRAQYYKDNNEDALLMSLEDISGVLDKTHKDRINDC